MIDPDRLRRAIHLDASPLPSGGWSVGAWTVDPHRGCDCPDRAIRGAVCKHELRARLDRIEPEILTALREVAT